MNTMTGCFVAAMWRLISPWPIVIPLAALGSSIAVFWNPPIAWLIHLVPVALVAIQVPLSRTLRPSWVNELSDTANARFQRWPVFYTYPGAMHMLRSTSLLMTQVMVVVTIVGAVKGFWWGIVFLMVSTAILGNCIAAMMPCGLMPSGRKETEEDTAAHDELVAYVRASRGFF
jgi:hypothetical protein